MEKNLPIAYKSQWDEDAGKSNNDCGAASIAMILNYYGEKLTTNQVQEKTGAGGGLVSIEQLLTAIKAFGYSAEVFYNQTFDNIKKFINQDVPVLALVHYGSLNSTQDKNFKGGHFFDVVGYRADNSVYVNDPNFQGELRAQGDHHVYTFEEFMKAWGDCKVDGNPSNCFVVVYRNEVQDKSFLPKIRVTTEKGMRLRTHPVINTQNIDHVAKQGTEFKVLDKVTGDSVDGNYTWYEIEGNLYIHSGGVEAVEQPKPVEPQAPDYKKLYEEAKGQRDDALAVINQIAGLINLFNKTPDPAKDKKSFWDSLLFWK